MSPETLDGLMKNVQMLNVDGQTKIVFKMDGIEALIILTGDMKFVDARIVIDVGNGFKADLSVKQGPYALQNLKSLMIRMSNISVRYWNSPSRLSI